MPGVLFAAIADTDEPTPPALSWWPQGADKKSFMACMGVEVLFSENDAARVREIIAAAIGECPGGRCPFLSRSGAVLRHTKMRTVAPPTPQ